MTGKTARAAIGAALMVLGVTAQAITSAPAAATERHRQGAATERQRQDAATERRRQDAATERRRQAQARPAASHQPQPAAARGHQAQRGRASYYGAQFNGRRMANGARFNPRSNVAAHRTLPLGSRVQVTNLENGRTTEVRIEDRGPYVGGRVIDLTPRTAEELGMKQQGVAPVEVRPIEVPERNQRVAQR